MHQHTAHSPLSPDTPSSSHNSTAASILDSLSETLLNAFTKVRKPDERFLEIRDTLDKFEESLVAIERTEARVRTRLGGQCSSSKGSTLHASICDDVFLMEAHNRLA